MSSTSASQLFSDVLAAYLEDLSECQAVVMEAQSVHSTGGAPTFTAPSLSLGRQKSRSSSSQHTQVATPSMISPLSYIARPPLPLPKPIPSMDYFCAEAEPPISYQKYIQRLLQYFRCSPECFVLLVVYLRRAVYDKSIFVNIKNVHRLCLVGLLLAVKQREDIYYSMKYYSSVGGVQVRDLMDMELKFFADVLQYRGHVEEEEYRAAVDAMSTSWRVRLNGQFEGSLLPSTSVKGVPSSTPRRTSPPHQTLLVPHPALPMGKGMPSRVGSSATSCGLSGMSSPFSESYDMAPPPSWVLDCGLYW